MPLWWPIELLWSLRAQPTLTVRAQVKKSGRTGTSGTCFDQVKHEHKVSGTPGKTGNVLSTAAHDQIITSQRVRHYWHYRH